MAASARTNLRVRGTSPASRDQNTNAGPRQTREITLQNTVNRHSPPFRICTVMSNSQHNHSLGLSPRGKRRLCQCRARGCCLKTSADRDSGEDVIGVYLNARTYDEHQFHKKFYVREQEEEEIRQAVLIATMRPGNNSRGLCGPASAI